jgi:hypothetical protein
VVRLELAAYAFARTVWGMLRGTVGIALATALWVAGMWWADAPIRNLAAPDVPTTSAVRTQWAPPPVASTEPTHVTHDPVISTVPTTKALSSPVAIPQVRQPGRAVQSGAGRHCYLEAGQVWCWGHDMGLYHGTWVEDPAESEPVLIPLPGPASLLSVGEGQECAAVDRGQHAEIWCWGTGYHPTEGYSQQRFAPSAAPVLMWQGHHVHGLDVGYQQARAYVGTFEGWCGWVSWGVAEGRVVNWPEHG